MGIVKHLKHCEVVQLDRAQLETLHIQLGTVLAEKEINQSLEDLARALARISAAYKTQDMTSVTACANDLVLISRKLGMTALARVARDVRDLTGQTPSAAYHATIARLARIGEGSLIAVWDLQDMSL